MQVQLNATATAASCPSCQQISSKVQSHYQRQLADLNWSNFSVQLKLTLRRFYCYNPDCRRKVFCKRLDDLTKPYARITNRLYQLLKTLAIELGGRPGVRVAKKQCLMTSRATLLRILARLELPTYPTPRVLGVDEFALKRGQTYAALLVDLEKQQPVDVLPDRTSKTFGEWLKAYSGVEIITRDRASGFTKAIRSEAPNTQQIADRFHILRNLSEQLDRFFKRKKVWQMPLLSLNKLLAKAQSELNSRPASDGAVSETAKVRKLKRDEQLKQASYARRLERYQNVVALKQKGLSNRAIGQELGLGRNTVNRYISAGSAEVVASKPKTPRPSLLDPYKAYLLRRWLEEQAGVKQLHQEITVMGYSGSSGPVQAFLATLRPVPNWSALRSKVRPKLEAKDLPKGVYARKLSSKSATWLIFKLDKDKEALSEEQRYQLKQLLDKDSEIKQVYELVQEFRQLVREKRGSELKEWLARANATGIKELNSFSRGIEHGQSAVEAGLSSDYSNAQLEGQVNRAKAIKKQMYGRASFKLLRTRILAA